jgi:hypothetical protein
MDRYGYDMQFCSPEYRDNEMYIKRPWLKKNPDRFRACCSDQTTRLLIVQGKLPNWKFEMSLDEVSAALKTGKYVGIGEFSPGLCMYYLRTAPIPSFEERREQYKAMS